MKIVCLLLIIFLPTGYLSSIERHKPLPLTELQNKKSAYYIPIPYPKTREDIIVDLDYGLTQTFMGQYKEIVTARNNPSDEVNDQQVVEDYLLKEKGYRVGDIIKVYNKHFYNPFEFDYLIEVLGPDGVPVFRTLIDPSGRWKKYSRSMGYPWPLLKEPFSDDSRVIGLLKKANISKDELFESDYYNFPEISSDDNPAKRIISKDQKIYYVSCDHRVYLLRERLKDQGDSVFKAKMFKARANHSYNKESSSKVIHDTVDDEFLILEEIK